MIDRIEELLGLLAAEEDDEEQQEDVLALTAKEEAVPASPRGDGGETGEVGTGDRSGGRTAGDIVSERPGLIAGEIAQEWPMPVAGETGDGGAQDRSGGRTAGEIVLERPGLIAGETETAEESAQAAGELWKDGPVWTVRSGPPEIDGVRRAATAGRTAQTEETFQPPRDGETILSGLQWAVQGVTPGPAPEGAGRSGPEQGGLEGLYRQTVRGLRPAVPAMPPEQAGRTARAQEPGSAASLAVDELDRAVRRDSRRYDGGMSIY